MRHRFLKYAASILALVAAKMIFGLELTLAQALPTDTAGLIGTGMTYVAIGLALAGVVNLFPQNAFER